MPAVNFQPRFANAVLLGCLIGEIRATFPSRSLAEIRSELARDFPNEFPISLAPKRQTIRADRALGGSRFKVGDRLVLYTGMRTKQCRKLGEAVCSQLVPIRFDRIGSELRAFRRLIHIGSPTWRLVAPADLESVAMLDGFRTGRELLDWIESTHATPFDGHIVRWDPRP